MTRERAEALLMASDPMFFVQRERIIDLVVKDRLPGRDADDGRGRKVVPTPES
jgi:hypothetical protein